MKNEQTALSMNKSDSDPKEINIWLDSYDEMFSDFDPRPYSKRTISVDFIAQVKNVVRDRYGKKMTLQLLLPDHTGNAQDEQVISERIRNYFKITNYQLKAEKKKNNQKGLLLTISGIVLMLLASYISFLNWETFFAHVLRILFEPAGWFMLWMGLDQLVIYSESKRKELDFYSYMAETEIKFGTYSQVEN